MSRVNIGKDKNDKSYRYTMPRITAKVESSGNGIKTVIPNLPEVAKALHCELEYPLKFFGFELGAQTKFDKGLERAIVNGKHDAATFQQLLEKFIDTFILCPNCHLPEIKMHVKRGDIKIDCAACGHNGVLQTVHKLKNYIVKNPPVKKSKSDTEDRRGRGDEPEEVVEEVPLATKNDDEIEWFSDVSKEAQEKRKEAELDEMKTKDLEKSLEAIMSGNVDAKKATPAEMIRMLVEKDRSAAEILAELKRLELSRGLDEAQKLDTLLQGVLDATKPAAVVKQVKQRAEVFKLIVKDKSSGGMFLNCLEKFVGEVQPKVLKYLPHILQTLYEADVLDEEMIMSWYQSPPDSSWLVSKDVAAKARKKAKPVIDWLKNADEEDEDEEEEDD